ncbi:MAG TPA: hypothetical protein VMW87_16175 [Spirochaetia bacterium]|nr:hypothetical protein [Spirochaetia bacterium]
MQIERKRNRIPLVGILAILVILAISMSCSLTNVSINQRIDMFFSDLKTADASKIIDNISASATDYNAAKSYSFWSSTHFVSTNTPFTYDLGSASRSNVSTYGGTTMVTLATQDKFSASGTCVFWMIEESKDNWLIRAISYASSTVLQNVQ